MNFAEQYYCVVDIETTGKGLGGNRITEICIVRMHGSEIIEKFTSLVDPETLVPDFITRLTGIDNEMVATAPLFSEIADEVERMTRDCIFVAHNVNFDFNIIRNEFKRLGHDFKRRKLCTVRLSRKLIPGMHSYSLGKLCNQLGISLVDRHRAEGDTDATVTLFQHLLDIDEDGAEFTKFLKGNSQEGTFPPHLDRSQFSRLPDVPGVYLFKDQKGKVIYVGKAVNLRKRVLSHFYSKASKSYLMCQNIHYIEHIPTGNELVALLEEADLIRHYYPRFNSAQKKPRRAYQILHYKNQLGIIQFAVGLVKSYDYTVVTHYSRAAAVEQLEQLCIDHELCARFCSFKTGEECNSHYRCKCCKGVCKKEESVEDYNERAQRAIQALMLENPTYVIKQPGRHAQEECFVMVKEGEYQGYGYVDHTECISTFDECEDFIQRKKANYHTNQILRSYVNKHGNHNFLTETRSTYSA